MAFFFFLAYEASGATKTFRKISREKPSNNLKLIIDFLMKEIQSAVSEKDKYVFPK